MQKCSYICVTNHLSFAHMFKSTVNASIKHFQGKCLVEQSVVAFPNYFHLNYASLQSLGLKILVTHISNINKTSY